MEEYTIGGIKWNKDENGKLITFNKKGKELPNNYFGK